MFQFKIRSTKSRPRGQDPHFLAPWHFSILLFYALALIGCNVNPPTTSDIVGTWVNDDGATLKFLVGGTFQASGLSDEQFGFSEDQIWTTFNGEGNWSLADGQQFSVIDLDFKSKNKKPGSWNYQVLISGSNTLENRPPWYLFVWEGHDIGGTRYKFLKKPSDAYP